MTITGTVVVVVVALLISLVYGQDTNFKRVSLTDLDPQATCNDGSPATYFFRPSTTGSTVWTVYHEGGGFCYDIPSCEQRWNQSQWFMTSTLLPDVMNDTTNWIDHLGINSADPVSNPHFYDANQVYLWYCTSDVHAGDSVLGKWVFNGKRVVQTLINHLLHVQSPSMSSATYILYTGLSAGALGLWQNADMAAEMISIGAPKAVFRAYPDSGWLMDVPTYGTGNNDTRAQWQSLHTNMGLIYDEDCEKAHIASQDVWKCGFASVIYPYITTPLFVAGLQYDIPFLNGVPITDTKDLLVLREKFLNETSVVQTFFSPDCWQHGVIAYNDRWNVITVQNTTAAEAVYKWLSTESPSPSRHVDSCSLPNCNPTCPKSDE